MSESFLERWSRRKRDVAQQETEPEAAKAGEDPAREPAARVPAAGEPPAPAAEPPALDLSQLPSIESITAETDIRAFLAPGVPASLRHAALRRAWSADPTIRDFIGLSENAWDFTAPDGVPGFGPIGSSEEVQRLLAQLTGGGPEPAEKSGSEAAAESRQPPAPMAESGGPEDAAAAETSPALAQLGQDHAAAPGPTGSRMTGLLQCNEEDVASQQEEADPQHMTSRARRPHGGALPE